MLKRNEICIRDPFIYVDPEARVYYLYGSEPGEQTCFRVYRSADLQNFEEPRVIFARNPSFWGERDFWAPEVHKIEGRYYLFATFYSQKEGRRSAVLVCDTPDGTFVPAVPFLTPAGWYCLDATYAQGEEGERYAIFCHEWVQVGIGEICAVRLDKALRPVGNPFTLFRANAAPWASFVRNDPPAMVTDGPFLLRGAEGNYILLWSSFGKDTGYACGQATADSITGIWKQEERPLFAHDGGHGMVFRDLQGNLHLLLHAPNAGPEHPVLLRVEIREGRLILAENG